MSRWFRFYAEALDDPKVQKLPAEDFRAWVNLLCLACRNEGYLPEAEDIAFALRIDGIAARSLTDRLRIAGLIDTVKGGQNGSRIAPHGWHKRQYKSDGSTERVKRFRERSKTVAETPPDTEAETEVSVAKATAENGDPDKIFWDGAKGYLGKGSGGLVNKLCGQYGRGVVADALTTAMLASPQPPDRTAYLMGILKRQRQAEPVIGI